MMIQIGQRESHDIDIFLDDPQLLGFIDPSRSALHFDMMPADYLGDGLRFLKFAFEQVLLNDCLQHLIQFAINTEIPYTSLMTHDRFDPIKDAINREKHKLSLAFGERIFEDDNHLIIPSIREIDGEERFKVIGIVGEKLFTGVFVWRGDQPRFISVRRSNRNEERAYHSAG